VLLYGTAGLSFGSLQAESGGLQQSQTSVGWTAGVGAEVGIYQNWTAKIEYLYVDLSKNSYTITGNPAGMDSALSFGTVRIGVNYHF
jgi:outer membrane immunogenic protein